MGAFRIESSLCKAGEASLFGSRGTAMPVACCSRPIDGDEGIETQCVVFSRFLHRVTYSLRDCFTLAP